MHFVYFSFSDSKTSALIWLVQMNEFNKLQKRLDNFQNIFFKIKLVGLFVQSENTETFDWICMTFELATYSAFSKKDLATLFNGYTFRWECTTYAVYSFDLSVGVRCAVVAKCSSIGLTFSFF